jgi:hypothetical protein
MSRLERQDAVVAKSGGTTPDDHVTMSQRHAARPVPILEQIVDHFAS